VVEKSLSLPAVTTVAPAVRRTGGRYRGVGVDRGGRRVSPPPIYTGQARVGKRALTPRAPRQLDGRQAREVDIVAKTAVRLEFDGH
jgi:hypothetical protein